MDPILRQTDFFQLESAIWIAERKTNVPAYDFNFEHLFRIARPRRESEVEIIARIGAIAEYDKLYDQFLELDLRLVHSPEMHHKASELAHWYPEISAFTPKSKVYETFPSPEIISRDFEYPVFIKGNRQTAKHNPDLAIARNAEDVQRISRAYRKNPILHWQKIVVREFVSLEPLPRSAHDKVQLSFEFRTFWWKGNCVGTGHYWSQYLDYDWSESQKADALAIAEMAAKQLKIPFIAIDLALTTENKWIIIECNDAQESGYCGVNPLKMWKKIVALEQH